MVLSTGPERRDSQSDQGHATPSSSETSQSTDTTALQRLIRAIVNQPSTPHAQSSLAANKTTKQEPHLSSDIQQEEQTDDNMAHCQFSGPLQGPLRDRRRAEIASEHPVWPQARKFQSGLMHTQQTIRRSPGFPPAMAKEVCDMLTSHAQELNNAIRETVDDVSEIRIQIEDANVAIMQLKLSEGTLKHDISQMQKQIKDSKMQNEKTENRLADYHNDAEKDRNMIRHHLAGIEDEEDEEKKITLIKNFIEELKKMATIPHEIWVEPEYEPTEYEKAVARVKQANPGLIPDSPEEKEPVKPTKAISAFDAGKWNMDKREPIKFVEPWGSPSRRTGGNGKFSFLEESKDSPNTPNVSSPAIGSSQLQLSDRFRNHASTDVGNELFHPTTPRGQVNNSQGGSGSSYENGVYCGLSKGSSSSNMRVASLDRTSSSLERSGSGSFAGPLGPPALRPKAPEFHPGTPSMGPGSNTSSFGGASIDQIANTSYGQRQQQQQRQQTGFGASPGSFEQGSRPMSRAMSRPNGHNGFQDFNAAGQGFGSAPSRPRYGPSKYDNRAVVARSQPAIQLGQMHGSSNGDAHDLTRFENSFAELFGLARGFVVAWVAQDNSWDRNAPVMNILPKCYTGFTEHQAWSYIRQHMTDGLSRSCLFARVIVDFIVQRILVPSAWLGFDFKADAKLHEIENDKGCEPITTGNGRAAYRRTVTDIVHSILANDRYETFRETRIDYFAAELRSMLDPLMSRFADLAQADDDLRSLVGKAWSLSAKTLTSSLTFEYRFPDAGSRFSLQSMVAVAPNIDGFVLQADHWRVQLVVTPVITVRNDNGTTLSVQVTNLAETLLMK